MKKVIDFREHIPHDPRCRYDKMARGETMAWIRLVEHFICIPCQRKLDEGQMFCPVCVKWYVPKYPSKTMVPAEDKEAKEQWTSGTCSTSCWKVYLGIR
jgi:hypothetical protein